MSEWHLSRDGRQEGPLTASQIGAMLADGLFKANEAYVWKEGMAEWKTIAESGVLAESAMARARPAPAPSPVHQQPQPAAALNPYATPAAASHPGPATDEPGYPGFGRLEYFLWHIGLGAVSYVLLVLVGTNMGGSAHFDEAVWGPMILTIVLGTGVGSLYLGVQRVRNLGMSGWAILWHFVPFVILWISWRMFACPPGYDDHRQLDFAGKILTGLVAGTFVLAILASFMAA